jgi:hypothetical protein
VDVSDGVRAARDNQQGLAATADGKSTMWFDSTSLVCVRSFPASFFDFLFFSSSKKEGKKKIKKSRSKKGGMRIFYVFLTQGL